MHAARELPRDSDPLAPTDPTDLFADFSSSDPGRFFGAESTEEIHGEQSHTEAERLAALRQYQILDTLPETEYDDLAFLAAQLCGTPSAVISIGDGQRQWFKARFGVTMQQIPHSGSFCAHAARHPDRLLVVQDAREDPRFVDNPLVTGDPYIRFYAGAPIVVPFVEDPESADPPRPIVLGTICVFAPTSRSLSPEQDRALRALARQAGNLLDMRLRRHRQEETNRRLAESKRRLQEAQQIAHTGSWEYDLASGKLTWSREMFRLLGLDPDQNEADYAVLQQYYHPEDQSLHEAVGQKVLQDGEPYQYDLRVILADGTRRWLHSTGHGVKNDAGQVVRLMGTLQDITERKHAEAQLAYSEARLTAVLRCLRGGLLVVDEHDYVLLANDAFCDLFHLPVPPEALIGLNAAGVAHSCRAQFAEPDAFIAGIARRRREGVSVTAEPLLMADGRHLERDYVPTLLEDGYRGHLWLYRNVTRRKRVEERLQALNTELERSNEALQEFAHVASHDLKEPLRKIKSFGGMLQRRAGGSLSPESHDYLKRMIGATDRMQALLDGLLSYSRVSSKPTEFAPVDLNQIVTGVLSDLETRTAESGAQISVEPLPTLFADPLQMRQLFQNLIGNALKYRRAGIAPRVQVTVQQTPEQAVLSIRDNGIGFAPEHAERVFGVFERLIGRDQPQYEGTGVGLAICKKIVERHGGEITAEGYPGEGATFTVTLPLLPPTES